MDNSYKNKLEIKPPIGLKEAVLGRIELERKKKAFCKKMIYFCSFFISGAGFLLSIIFFGSEILLSDFWGIVSLAFTDVKIVAAYWQEFSLSLLETFPFEAFVIILMPIFILLVLIRKYSEQQNLMKLKFN